MEIKKFSPLYAQHLKLSDLFALNKTTIEIITPVEKDLENLIAIAFKQLKTVNSELDERLKQPIGSIITPELYAIDSKRDSLVDEIKRNVVTASKSSNATINHAGKVLQNFMKPYWTTTRQALNTESGLIAEMIGRYSTDNNLMNCAGTIGVAVLWNELGAVNTEFDTLYRQRNAETAAHDGPSASSLKSDAAKSYENLCTLVEQAVNLAPTELMNSLFNQLDNLRRTYQVLISKGNKDAEKK
jgi:hypothetical protein